MVFTLKKEINSNHSITDFNFGLSCLRKTKCLKLLFDFDLCSRQVNIFFLCFFHTRAQKTWINFYKYKWYSSYKLKNFIRYSFKKWSTWQTFLDSGLGKIAFNTPPPQKNWAASHYNRARLGKDCTETCRNSGTQTPNATHQEV